MKRILLAILLLSSWCFGTTGVTGHISTLAGTTATGNFVRFWLRGCGGNQPRVGGTTVIAPTQGGVFYFDVVANGSGDISGTLYSTRDTAGTGDGEIECGGSHTATWYGMQLFHAGKGGPETPISAKNGDSFDISNVTPITTNPVVTAPTGDTTYLRIDAGNGPVTGPLTINGAARACTINGIEYVGSGAPYSTCWGSSDIGAQINAAYAALSSSTGGVISVVPGAYSFSTPISFSTIGKSALLSCPPGANTNVSPTGVTQLSFTPTSGTAVTFNNGNGPLSGMSGCTLTGAGSGNATVGLLIGGTDGQFSGANFAGNGIQKFGTGLQFGSNTYTVTFRDNYIADNGTNMSVPVGAINDGEEWDFFGGVFGNHTSSYPTACVNILAGVEINFYGVSFDQCGVTLNAPTLIIGFYGAHFENPGGTTAADYITFGTLANVAHLTLSGGYMTEDTVSARTEFVNSLVTGSNDIEINVSGTTFNPAQVTAAIFNNSGGGCCSRLYINGYANGIGGSQFTTEAAGAWYTTLSKLGTYSFGITPKLGSLTNSNSVARTYTFPDATGTVSLAVGSGTATMTTALIGTLACGATVTVAATGVAATDAISWSFNAAPAANPGELVVSAWPTANNVNFQYCNSTAAGVTPNAATLNWRVIR